MYYYYYYFWSITRYIQVLFLLKFFNDPLNKISEAATGTINGLVGIPFIVLDFYNGFSSQIETSNDRNVVKQLSTFVGSLLLLKLEDFKSLLINLRTNYKVELSILNIIILDYILGLISILVSNIYPMCLNVL